MNRFTCEPADRLWSQFLHYLAQRCAQECMREPSIYHDVLLFSFAWEVHKS